MKKLTSISGILILLLSIFMASCKKDTPLSDAIIGKWDVESIMLVNYENSVKKTAETYFLATGDMAFQFVAGGTGIYYENSAVSGTFGWALNGNTLTITGAGSPLDWIVTNDKDLLSWTFSETETNNGIDYKYEYFYSARRGSR